MKRVTLQHSGLSLAIALSLLAPARSGRRRAAPADEASQATTLDKVTVTARKREETLQDVPVAVTAFTPETLDKLQCRGHRRPRRATCPT